MIAMPSKDRATPEGQALGLDEAAFRTFYDEALPRVYGYLLHRCGGVVATAEDLTQETFLAAVRELRRGRHVDSPIPWIYGIARHKLLDHYRRQERCERVIAANETAVAEPAGDSSADGARDRLMEALASVPAAQRAALVLRHVDGFSVPEVAATLDRSVEAVESLLTRARASFRRAYQEPFG
jgi:RNA polymerase sigma-70 factor (ECF subfamily)